MLLLLIIPLALSGVGYAVFSQKLTLNGTGADVAYTSTQSMLATYTSSSVYGGGLYTYSIGMTIKNNGATSVTAWSLKFNVPADMTVLSCPASVTCSTSGSTVTILNGAGNGTVAAGASTSYTFTFKTAVARYTLQNVIISGTYATTFQTISGLTVTAVQGKRTKKGSVYSWPVTITVTNNSGQSLSAWQVTIPWNSTTNTVASMPAGVTYVTNATQLIITSTAALAKGASYQFVPTLTSTNINWTTTGTTVQGKA